MAVNPKSLNNLKKFEKGHPNVGGRPKGVENFSTVLKRILEKEIDMTDPFTQKKAKVSAREAMMLVMLKKALSGDIKAAKEIIERLEGKPFQSIHVSSNEQKESHDDWVKRMVNGIDKGGNDE